MQQRFFKYILMKFWDDMVLNGRRCFDLNERNERKLEDSKKLSDFPQQVQVEDGSDQSDGHDEPQFQDPAWQLTVETDWVDSVSISDDRSVDDDGRDDAGRDGVVVIVDVLVQGDVTY